MLDSLWLLSLIWLAEFGLAVWALGDALLHRAGTYVAAGKLTKPKWLAILAFALVFVLLGSPFDEVVDVPAYDPISLLPIIAVVASSVYLADVRPALRSMRGHGGRRQRPYAPW